MAINSILDVVFIAKKEVRSCPGLGVLAALGQTIFIERKSLSALTQKLALEKRLKKGQSVFFFPEGTSTDGSIVKQFIIAQIINYGLVNILVNIITAVSTDRMLTNFVG